MVVVAVQGASNAEHLDVARAGHVPVDHVKARPGIPETMC